MALTDAATTAPREPRHKTGWRELYLKEDWWAVWLGVGLMVLAIALYKAGNPVLKTLAIEGVPTFV